MTMNGIDEAVTDQVPVQKKPPQINLLVVEDNLINQMLTKKTLERMGYLVQVVSNGKEAVKHCLEFDFQCVLMDVQMPIMDGIEATRQIRQKKGRSVPIIALTANAQETVEAACYDAGMNYFLTKPFSRPQLQSALDDALGMSLETYLA
jgi:CheY-like chemotaxis protein